MNPCNYIMATQTYRDRGSTFPLRNSVPKPMKHNCALDMKLENADHAGIHAPISSPPRQIGTGGIDSEKATLCNNPFHTTIFSI